MKRQRLVPLLLLLPFLFLLAVFLLGLCSGLVQSFGIVPSLGLTEPTLRYYQELFCSDELWRSLGYSLYLSVVSSVLAVIGGVLLCSALVLSGKAKGRKKMVGILQLPIMLPHVVVALFAMNLLSQSGLLARLLYALGIISGQESFPDLLFDQAGVGIILSYLWKEIPFVAFFVVTLMAAVNENLGEAARNLGASPIQAFFRVTLPLCMPAIKNAFLIVLAFSFGAYELPFLLGPTTPKALPVAAYLEYISPDLKNRPRAMAMNSIVLFISLGMAWLYYCLFQQKMIRLHGGKSDEE